MESLMMHVGQLQRFSMMHRSIVLEEEGLNGIQHSYILRICQHPGITQDQLAQMLCVHKSNVARQLSLLEGAGYLTRTPKEGDRRALCVFPTQKMLEVLPRVRAVLDEWNAYLLAELPKEQRALLMRVMPDLVERARQRVRRESRERGGV